MSLSTNGLANEIANCVDSRIAKAFGTSLNSTVPTASGDFDIRQFDSVGILIHSIDADNNLIETPIHYVNPDLSDRQLVEFGKSIIADTTDTYNATYRVTKTLCDKTLDPHLIVDSPFTEDLTDNCGVVWNPTSSVTISDGAAQFNKSYLLSAAPVTFGGKDFTVALYTNMSSRSNIWCGLFNAQISAQSGTTTTPGRISFFRNSNYANLSCDAFNEQGTNLISTATVANNFLNALHHFEMDYVHDSTTLKIFIDGVQTYENTAITIERLARYLLLGATGYDAKSQRMVGSISHFQIYDGLALHTTNFTPE